MQHPLAPYLIKQFDRYWLKRSELLELLPVVHQKYTEMNQFTPCQIALPKWAEDLGVEGNIVVPSCLVADKNWQSVDWWSVIDWYLNCRFERWWESQKGTIHSYSVKLPAKTSIYWQRAWANRIAMFLRRWAAELNTADEAELFGQIPKAQCYLTHDVDAVHKTFAIRLKQSLFSVLRTLNCVRKRQFKAALIELLEALRFGVSRYDYWQFETILEIESRFDVTSHYFFYAHPQKRLRSAKAWLFDPGYNVLKQRIAQMLSTLHQAGHSIGLHQSFGAWQDTQKMQNEKSILDKRHPEVSRECRQHWLRFSFKDTWRAQIQAGFIRDFTLGFNDVCGFRAGAAVAFQPLSQLSSEPMAITATPTILMDSQLYSYGSMTDAERQGQINSLLTELQFVGGSAAVIWHQRVFSEDYGWGPGYQFLLQKMQDMQIEAV